MQKPVLRQYENISERIQLKKLIIHPGSPKTATSTLQRVLQQNRQLLEQNGIGVVLPQDIRATPMLREYLKEYRAEVPSSIAETANQFYAPLMDKYDTVIVSEETFCFDFMPSRENGLGGIDRAAAAAELLAQNSFHETEIVLTIRPQIELLISSYTHFVHRRRESRPFPLWLQEEVDLNRLLWQPAVAAFCQQFSRTGVRVVSMQAAKSDGMEAYIRQILAALGIADLVPDIAVDKVYNPSPSARAVKLCNILNRMIQDLGESRKINDSFVRIFPADRYKPFQPHIDIPDHLEHRFHQDHDATLRAADCRNIAAEAPQPFRCSSDGALTPYWQGN